MKSIMPVKNQMPKKDATESNLDKKFPFFKDINALATVLSDSPKKCFAQYTNIICNCIKKCLLVKNR